MGFMDKAKQLADKANAAVGGGTQGDLDGELKALGQLAYLELVGRGEPGHEAEIERIKGRIQAHEQLGAVVTYQPPGAATVGGPYAPPMSTPSAPGYPQAPGQWTPTPGAPSPQGGYAPTPEYHPGQAAGAQTASFGAPAGQPDPTLVGTPAPAYPAAPYPPAGGAPSAPPVFPPSEVPAYPPAQAPADAGPAPAPWGAPTPAGAPDGLGTPPADPAADPWAAAPTMSTPAPSTPTETPPA